MKRAKLILKVDRNKRGKVYVGGKWQKDVTCIDVHCEPNDYTVTIEKYKRDSSGRLSVANGEIERTTKTYNIGG